MTEIEELLKRVQSLSPGEQRTFRELLDQSNGGVSTAARCRDLLLRRMLDEGLIREIKQPGIHPLPMAWNRIEIQGKPLSQTVIEERR